MHEEVMHKMARYGPENLKKLKVVKWSVYIYKYIFIYLFKHIITPHKEKEMK